MSARSRASSTRYGEGVSKHGPQIDASDPYRRDDNES